MNNFIKLGLGALAILIVYTVVLRILTPDFLVKEVTVTEYVETDVDTLSIINEYLEQIPEEDVEVVRVKVPVPEPEVVDEYMTKYVSTYSDSAISAKWTTFIEGRLETQEFEYYLKQRLVRERTTTITQNIRTFRTEQTTLVQAPRGYLVAGAEFTELERLSFSLGYVTPTKYQFYVKYDINYNAYSIGIQVPLRFNLFSLL